MDNPFEPSVKRVWTIIAIFMAVPVGLIFVYVKFMNGGTTTPSILFYVGFILFFTFPYIPLIIQLMTKFTDSHIGQPSLFGVKILHWQEIIEIRDLTTAKIILVGSDTKINIIVFVYKFPQELLTEIRSRVPDAVFPSETQMVRDIYRRKQKNAGRSALSSFIFIVLIFIFVKNLYAVFFGVLIMAVIMIYEIRNWFKYRRPQA